MYLVIFTSSNKAMQESMQGIVSKDIFNNNSYLCTSSTNKKSKTKLIFKNGEFKFTHLGEKKVIETLWYGDYNLVQKSVLLFKTKEFIVKDELGRRTKREGELLVNIKGNASYFKMESKEFTKSCTRLRQ